MNLFSQIKAGRIWRTGSVIIPMVIILSACFLEAGADWELRRDDSDKRRPAVKNETVTIDLNDPSPAFCRYLNELGIKKIIIRFQDKGLETKILSFVWTGGSQGMDRFSVRLDGIDVGASQISRSEMIPYAWMRDEFLVRLGPGQGHVLEIVAMPDYASAIEFAGIRLADDEEGPYRPLCYESIGSQKKYEKQLGSKGTVIKTDSIWIFAPFKYQQEARSLSGFLNKAHIEMKHIYGIDPLFTFSIELYPKGHSRGWGGISGMGTLGYTVESLNRFTQYVEMDVRGFAGFTEEMSHGFKSYYKCDGTYEALGLAVQEEITRRLVSTGVADKFWQREHRQWEQTYHAYIAANKQNPDPDKYPWNVLYTRILNHLFYKMQTEYGPDMWRDFFKVARQMDYPLHREAKTERMKVYADIFSVMFGRDMRKEFTDFGIDLDCDPPWGWQTYKR